MRKVAQSGNPGDGSNALPAVHIAFVNSVALWWGCARPVTRKLWWWESSVRCRVRMSASGGNTGSGADLRVTVGAVGFAQIFHPGPKKERNFSATGSGFPLTSLHTPPSEKDGRVAPSVGSFSLRNGSGGGVFFSCRLPNSTSAASSFRRR
jgi:hypothetical protein